jgi:hypothetical protein
MQSDVLLDCLDDARLPSFRIEQIGWDRGIFHFECAFNIRK